LAYSEGAEKAIITCQARLKRQSVESSAKSIDFKGDTSQPAVKKYQEEQKKDVTWNG
jgi:hypothetical protein